jgi:predicted transcriptional regulator
MEVHFTPEQEAQLSQIATEAGTDAERLVKDAALRLLQEDAGFRAAVREGIAQADRGELIEEEEMDARLADAPLINAYQLDAGRPRLTLSTSAIISAIISKGAIPATRREGTKH